MWRIKAKICLLTRLHQYLGWLRVKLLMAKAKTFGVTTDQEIRKYVLMGTLLLARKVVAMATTQVPPLAMKAMTGYAPEVNCITVYLNSRFDGKEKALWLKVSCAP